MREHLAHASLFSALLGTVGVASAADVDRSFSLSPASLNVQGTATATGTISLPKSGTSAFNINFVVPQDYAADTSIFVKVYMQQPTAGPCTAATNLGAATRRRVNRAASSAAAPNVDRIQPSGGGGQTTTFPATGGVITIKTYIVRTPMAASFTGLHAGDGIDMRIDRVSTDAADTCTGSVFVAHVDVEYKSISAP